MGGRTNNAGDWLTGKTQDQYDSQVANAKRSAELLRKSGYKRAINDRTGEEYDWREERARKALGGTDTSNWTEDQWKELGELDIANYERDWFDPKTREAKPEEVKPPPVTPDYTDEVLKKTRTNAWQRLQMGKNQKSSFTAGKLGGFDIAKPVLGGY